MVKTLLIRADAGGRLGTGHVMRMLALAQAWEARGGKCIFASCWCPEAIGRRLASEGFSFLRIDAEPGSSEDLAFSGRLVSEHSASAVALDGYHFEEDFQSGMSKICERVLLVDDHAHQARYTAPFLLNQNLGAGELGLEERASGSRFLLGTDFALLRREYLPFVADRPKPSSHGTRLLVTLGGTDPDNVAAKVLTALAEFREDDLDVRVLVGGNPMRSELESISVSAGLRCEFVEHTSSMTDELSWADLAITAGGSTCWEMAFMGVPMLVITIADNQAGISRELARAGAAVSLGWHAEVQPSDLGEALRRLRKDRELRARMGEAGQKLVDGRGAHRVAAALDGSLSVTIATPEDSWMNDFLEPFTRELHEMGHRVQHVHHAREITPSDITFLLSFEEIVDPGALSRSSNNLVVHASALPEGRGWSPLTWQVLEGRSRIPLTLLEAADSVDSGRIYATGGFDLEGHELVGEMRAPLATEILRLCHGFVREFPMVVAKGQEQDGEATYYPRRGKDDSRLDLDRSLRDQVNLLRVVDNDRYPAFFDYLGHRFIIKIQKQRQP